MLGECCTPSRLAAGKEAQGGENVLEFVIFKLTDLLSLSHHDVVSNRVETLLVAGGSEAAGEHLRMLFMTAAMALDLV